MKRILMMMIVLAASVLVAEAQVQVLKNHSGFGSKAAYDVTLNKKQLTVTFTPQYTFTGYQFAADTNLVIKANVSRAYPGNMLFLEVKGDSKQRFITFDDNFTGVFAKDTLNINKTRLWSFLFINNKFVQINRSAEY